MERVSRMGSNDKIGRCIYIPFFISFIIRLPFSYRSLLPTVHHRHFHHQHPPMEHLKKRKQESIGKILVVSRLFSEGVRYTRRYPHTCILIERHTHSVSSFLSLIHICSHSAPFHIDRVSSDHISLFAFSVLSLWLTFSILRTISSVCSAKPAFSPLNTYSPLVSKQIMCFIDRWTSFLSEEDTLLSCSNKIEKGGKKVEWNNIFKLHTNVVKWPSKGKNGEVYFSAQANTNRKKGSDRKKQGEMKQTIRFSHFGGRTIASCHIILVSDGNSWGD